MTREEFEALLKMEGMHLEVRPITPFIRNQKQRKCFTYWQAIVWEPMRMSHLVISPHFAKALGVNLNDLLDDYIQHISMGGKTNHQAVKELIKYYLERVQKRADN
jgi:hypothetical protein